MSQLVLQLRWSARISQNSSQWEKWPQLSNQPNPFTVSWFSYIPSHTRSSSHSRTGFSLGATSSILRSLLSSKSLFATPSSFKRDVWRQ